MTEQNPGESRPSGAQGPQEQPAPQRILLVTSAAPAQSPFSTKEKRPPLGLGFLISVLRNAGHKVFFIDNYLQPSDFLETEYLQDHAIDFVGIYANTICFRDTLRMLRGLQGLRETHRWQGRIIVGGPHAAVAPQTIPDWVDYVVQGEGERAMLDIVAGKVAERVVRYPRIENLDELPMPAWDCFVNLPYSWDTCFLDDTPVFTMNTSRGCPFQCTFCSVGSVWGRRYTCFSADRVVSDIEHLAQNYGAKGVYFREDNFTLNEARLRRFCQLMLEKGIAVPWVCESRVSTLTRELVELMARAGARGFYFGVESGAQRMLDLLGKGITVEQTENAFRWCHEFGIKAAASVVVGVPGETPADLAATQDLLQRIRPTIVWPNVFVGIPDSRLYRSVLDSNGYEYIDDRGLVYLPGHNERVQCYYGGSWNAGIPNTEDAKDGTSRPKVSVLLAVHNGEQFVRPALASIYHQTYQDFEVVIVDDGSTDGTPEILRQMKDSRTIIYRNAENQGLTKSLNTGLRLCRGEYVARMDADDVSHPRRLEKQVQFLESHPEVALVGTSYYQIDAEGTVIAPIEVPADDSEIRERLREKNCFGHGTVIVRRDVLVACGGYDERYVCAQDYDLWLRIAEGHRLANLREPLYYWRSTGQGISHARKQEQKRYKDLAVREAEKRRRACVSAGRMGRHPPDADPLVSVIVPTYNRPELLHRAIRSILNQTYRNIEIVVVNDAGADVESILHPLNARGNIIHIRHPHNKGLAAARNTGIRAARGKYIAYLDDDDIYFPEHIGRLVTALEGADYRVAHTEAVRSHQEKRGDRYVETERTTPYTTDVTHDGLLVRNLVPVLCVMHEKACLDDVGYFDETLPTHEDWDLWIRLSRRYPFLHIRQVTAEVTWRTDGSTMTSRRTREFLTVPEIIYHKHRDFVADKPDVAALQRERLRLLQGPLPNSSVPARGGGRAPAGDIPTAQAETPQILVPSWPRMLNIAVKACTPSRERSHWGDTWFAHGLGKALIRAGHNCAVHFRNEWDAPDQDIDVAIHIKGLAPYTPKPHCLNLIWIISHPELHTAEELNRFDAVFCASPKYLEQVRRVVRVPCFYLPQATDSEIFRPLDPRPPQDIGILFVGNNYYGNRRRQIINDLLATGRDYDLWVIGLAWRGWIEERFLKAEYVHPQKLPELYARAKIVLNDHHETMRRWGFVNDRTYNLAALQAFQISDPVEGLEELGVVTYRGPEDLRRKLDFYLAHDREREQIARLTHDRCKNFTFTHAAETILGVIRDLQQAKIATSGPGKAVAAKSTPARTGTVGRNRPGVSVVVTCHDAERFLPECLDSILNQTMPDWELLVMDDGSRDGTRAIIETYAQRDRRIRPFCFTDNQGPYVRRNFAIRQARAGFILIQDADNILCPNKLQRLYEEITKDALLGIVGSGYRMFLDEFRDVGHTEGVLPQATHEQILDAYRTRGICDFCWLGSAITRRELYDEIGLYDENPFGADSFWLAKAAEYACCTGKIRFANTPEFLTLRRMHGDSLTGRLPTFDPRSRRARYWQYCQCKLRQVREKMQAVPGTDIARELRNCDCSDFLVRFKAHILKWESEPLDGNVMAELLGYAVRLFNETLYVTCVGRLAGLEVMQPDIARRWQNYDLLRALALFALDRKEQSLCYVQREIESHDSRAAKEFLVECLEADTPRDVQSWCVEKAGLCELRLVDAAGRVAALR